MSRINDQHNQDTSVFNAARQCWEGWADLRRRRERLKRFTYGQQWDDPEVLPDGRCVSEREAARILGATPQTNNLLRQLVKSVVGRFRVTECRGKNRCTLPRDVAERNCSDELDARMMEEFLISGCAVQRIVSERRTCGSGVWIDNISPSRFFCNLFSDPRGHDLELVGVVHSMSLNELKMRLGGRDGEACRRIEALATAEMLDAAIPGTAETPWGVRRPGRLNIVEVWTLESRNMLRCLDRESGNVYLFASEATAALEAVDSQRSEKGRGRLTLKPMQTLRWRCRWFTSAGVLLRAYDSPYSHGEHPFTIKLYPLIDGEVHPFVEDIVDQQKHVNRLITLIDHVTATSAKGAILFPQETLPKGISWEEMAERWGRPGALIPYDGRYTDKRPETLTASGTDAGAASLLGIELRMMEQVSGVSSALQGLSTEQTTRTSGSLYSAQAENSAAALRDIFDTFNSFRRERDRKALATEHRRR